MSRQTIVLLLSSHLVVGVIGFAGGLYALPILIAPDSPAIEEISAQQAHAQFKGIFRRDLKGSDFFHWGEGEVSVGPAAVTLKGKLAPGPDYVLYLSPEFVENEEDFARIKSEMVKVGEVRTFNNFIVPLPKDIDLTRFNSVIVWCERFGEFITAAQYQL
ncbi:MAG: DM13 domain-containing protein [Vibrionaceae bacterium]